MRVPLTGQGMVATLVPLSRSPPCNAMPLMLQVVLADVLRLRAGPAANVLVCTPGIAFAAVLIFKLPGQDTTTK